MCYIKDILLGFIIGFPIDPVRVMICSFDERSLFSPLPVDIGICILFQFSYSDLKQSLGISKACIARPLFLVFLPYLQQIHNTALLVFAHSLPSSLGKKTLTHVQSFPKPTMRMKLHTNSVRIYSWFSYLCIIEYMSIFLDSPEKYPRLKVITFVFFYLELLSIHYKTYTLFIN